MKYMEAIFRELSIIQKANGWSDAQLARELGTFPSTLCRYKLGKREPVIIFIKQLARMAVSYPNLQTVLQDYLREDELMVKKRKPAG